MRYGETYHKDHQPILLKTWQVMFYEQNHIGRASHSQPLMTMLGTQGDRVRQHVVVSKLYGGMYSLEVDSIVESVLSPGEDGRNLRYI